MASQAGRSRTFFSHTLPIFLMERRQQFITAGVSFLIHLVVALIMAMWILPAETTEQIFGIIAKPPPDPEEMAEAEELVAIVQPELLKDLQVDSRMQQIVSALDQEELHDVVDADANLDAALDLEPTDAFMEKLFRKGEFGGRSGAGKEAAVRKYGGTAESELAVISGLQWLTRIQQQDGSWSFGSVGQGAVPGAFNTTDMGATSLALLCFLGAGHTHVSDGPYQETVQRGLRYLIDNVDMSSGEADLRGRYQGNSGMYVQGIATICLCEAHALEHRDEELEKVAQLAIKFIERAQEPVGGGWRYEPGDPGDTSVVGWQLMAYQSAKSGRLRVSSPSMRDGRSFLNSVQAERGAKYRYTRDNDPSATMTAVGLLCRIYMGWRKDREALQSGVNYLATIGPSESNIYYNYYATQVLHHYGEDLWEQWNSQMREHLVRTQIKDGPAAGSWDVTDPHGRQGGQIYQTALSILTLEVYYRHLPIYQRLGQEPSDPSEQAVD
jgi:hypothetical protein